MGGCILSIIKLAVSAVMIVCAIILVGIGLITFIVPVLVIGVFAFIAKVATGL